MKLKILFLLFILLHSSRTKSQQAVDDWADLNLPNLTVSVVEQVPSGDLPAYTRLVLLSEPTVESHICIEVWLPRDNWNGRFAGTGNGGGAGSIDRNVLSAGVKNGFAVANTDMGTSPHVDSLVSNPSKWKDFGYRATHEMTVAAKAVIEKHYGRPPSFSYFIGCSTGGQQALMTAQRYPNDYNGILAGAPANNRTHLHTLFLWNYLMSNQNPENKFTKQQIESITGAVLKVNAGKDGGYAGDSFLTDPRIAVFEPEALDTCLTGKQIQLLKQIYSGPVNPLTGEQIYTPIPLGSESAGAGLFEQQNDWIKYHFYPFRWIFGLDFDDFDFNDQLAKVDSVLAPVLNANNPDLEDFRAAGGKLLMYTGTADPLVPFQDAVHYYERVVEKQGGMEKTQTFFRYFLVPGMFHCGGGPGPCSLGQWISSPSDDSDYNLFAALIKWVEEAAAPEQIIASAYKENGEVRFRRPVYPYPLFPHYIEGKNPDLPESYRGVAHERGKVAVPAGKYLQ
ncbi:MAG: tannase/feruloyl esterase family alpha/beta hydrolase [Dysgonamonadaceae bacterium]|jgi:feruloyl esterase|nr:tannase/feruloyl esterase family alpha/beta hydrolase [Dysgonamonadaceae bacterium]